MAETKKKTATKVAKKEVGSPEKVKTARKAVSEKEVIVKKDETLQTKELKTEDKQLAATAAKTVAKAGKHSAKALKEAAEKEAKEERKAHAAEVAEEAETKPKPRQKPARPRIERQGKKFREAAKLIEKDKEYSLAEALSLTIKTSPTKFDAAVELHVRLSVDPKQADQNIRGSLVLPAGTGKPVRVAVFADAEGVAAAKKAGADIAGEEELLGQLEKGVINFDTLIATPAMMPKLGKYARVLGPKGLMPNPKSGTVATNVAKAVEEAKAGRVEYRVDSTGIIHLAIGKVSFGADKLSTNARTILDNIKSAKPSSIKDAYVKTVHLTTSMGPSVKVLASEV